jgi:cephalosporin-C deacetylase
MTKDKLMFFLILCTVWCSTGAQADDRIAEFWKLTRMQLNKIPMQTLVVPVPEAVPYRMFRITLHSLNNTRVTALLSLPIQGEERRSKPWPVIISLPGYGGKQQGVMLGECQRGYAVLQVFPRGQGESTEFYQIAGDKLTGQLDRPDGAYYQGAYADVMRMIDFVVSRSDLDSNRIVLAGTSQGGGISLAVAALDQRIKAVIAHVPFLCNFRLAAKTENSLVKQLLDKAGKNNELSLNTLDYFDPLQLVHKLRVPVLVSAGGKDSTCPLSTIQSVYERLPGTKSLKIYPNLKHTSCLDFYKQSWLWLDQNLI